MRARGSRSGDTQVPARTGTRSFRQGQAVGLEGTQDGTEAHAVPDAGQEQAGVPAESGDQGIQTDGKDARHHEACEAVFTGGNTMNMKKGKKQPRTPDIMRKGGAMRDRTKYSRKAKHKNA